MKAADGLPIVVAWEIMTGHTGFDRRRLGLRRRRLMRAPEPVGAKRLRAKPFAHGRRREPYGFRTALSGRDYLALALR